MEGETYSCETILQDFGRLSRLAENESDEELKMALDEILVLWTKMINLEAEATEDDLFMFNLNRTTIVRVIKMVLKRETLTKNDQFRYDLFISLFKILADHPSDFRRDRSNFINSNLRLLLELLSTMPAMVPFRNDDLTEDKDRRILIGMKTYVDEDSNLDELTDDILSFIWNLSDRTLLVPMLLNADYAASCLNWYNKFQKRTQVNGLVASIQILHNLARHEDGIDALNRLNALEALNTFQPEMKSDESLDDCRICVLMIRVLLTNIQVLQVDRRLYSNENLNTWLQTMLDAAGAERQRHNGSHFSEPLIILVKLCHNRETLEYVLTKAITRPSLSLVEWTEFFVDQLEKFYSRAASTKHEVASFTSIVLLNMIWLISNHPIYHVNLCSSTTLIGFIKRLPAKNNPQLINRFMPKTMRTDEQIITLIKKNLQVS